MEKRKLNLRKPLSFVLAFIFVFQILVFSSDVKAQTDIAYYERLIALQENAVKANEALNQAFGHNEDGTILFPADFAGVWIDGSNLVVSLIDTSEENLEQYRTWAGEYAGCLRFEEAEYSYQELEDAENLIVNDLHTRFPEIGIAQYYVSEMDNKVIVGIDSADMSIIESTPAVISYDYPVEFECIESSTDTYINLYGGEELHNITSRVGMSISCCGTYNGANAVLTCGHRQKKGDVIKNILTNDIAIGTITYHQWEENQNGDFSIISISINSENMFSTTAIIREVTGFDEVTGLKFTKDNEITGTNSDVPVNTTVKYVGNETGYVSYGTVNARNVTIVKNGTTILKTNTGISTIKVIYGGATEGDSGGAVFMDNANNGVTYCGVLKGRALSNGYLTVWFTPYIYVSATGFRVKTG